MTIAEDQSTFGIYDAKTNFASLIERVMSGESLTITKHGKPVATIEPVARPKPDVNQLLEDLQKVRSLLNLGSPDYRALIGRDDH